MELHLALKNIVNLSGTGILKEQRLVNILADFNAYDDIPSAKFIIKTIIDEGFMEKLLANGKWDLNCDKMIDQFAAMTGMVKDNVSYVFESFGYSMGWSVSAPIKPNPITVTTNLKVQNNIQSNSLQSVVEIVEPKDSGYELSLRNPTAATVGKGKIIVSCEVHGKAGTSIQVNCSIYANGVVVQTKKFPYVYSWNYNGFTIVSSEIKLKCETKDINKIVLYFGN